MKQLYIILNLLISSLLLAQMGINTNTPTSILDVSVARDTSGNILDNNRPYGFQAPRLTLTELSNVTATYGADQVGALVYITDASGTAATGQRINIVDEGYYYFDGSVWKNMVLSVNNIVSISSIVDPNILGYVPSTTANATTAGVPTISGTTVTKLGTAVYNENGHSYATYLAGRIITWYEAYNAARSLGGYLATFTSDAEWQFVEKNLITPRTEFSTYDGWIGFAKYSWFAGTALVPDPEMKWITGEQPNHDYSEGGSSAVRKSNWFATNEPNNSSSTEGFVHFYRASIGNTRVYNGYTSTHPWNDVQANNTGQAIRGFVVEFQQ